MMWCLSSVQLLTCTFDNYRLHTKCNSVILCADVTKLRKQNLILRHFIFSKIYDILNFNFINVFVFELLFQNIFLKVSVGTEKRKPSLMNLSFQYFSPTLETFTKCILLLFLLKQLRLHFLHSRTIMLL